MPTTFISSAALRSKGTPKRRPRGITFAYLKGCQVLSGSKAVYLRGQDTATKGVLSAYTIGSGESSDSSNQGGHLDGYIAVQDSQSAYISSASTHASNLKAYCEGFISGTGKQGAFLSGASPLEMSTRASFLAGGIISGQTAFLHGALPAGTTKAAYLEGIWLQLSVPAYLYGEEHATTVQAAYTRGYSTTQENLPAYARGSLEGQEALPAYVTGLDSALSQAPAFAVGIGTAGSVQVAYLAGLANILEGHSSYLAGAQATLDHIPGYTRGEGQATGSGPAYLDAFLPGISSSVASFTHGLSTSQAGTGAFLLGAEVSTSTPAYLTGIVFMAAGTLPAYLSGRSFWSYRLLGQYHYRYSVQGSVGYA